MTERLQVDVVAADAAAAAPSKTAEANDADVRNLMTLRFMANLLQFIFSLSLSMTLKGY